jgi:hypothetical protein
MRRARWCAAATAVLLLAACSTDRSTKPSPVVPLPSSSAVAPAEPVELTCADAGGGNAPSDVTAAGLNLEGPAAEITDPPLASDVGLIVPVGSNQHFRKAPAYLPAGSPPVTIELTTPTAGQGLAWVPAADWAGGSPPDLRPWITNKVTFAGCPDRASTYFGGLLATDPRACLDLTVAQEGKAVVAQRLRLNGSAC